MKPASRMIHATAVLIALPSLSLAAGNPTAAGIQADAADGSTREFLDMVDDATTTAAVKSRLVENSKTKALDVEVHTDAGVVTLSGTVRSEKERELAAALARHTRNVWRVHNNLVVESS